MNRFVTRRLRSLALLSALACALLLTMPRPAYADGPEVSFTYGPVPGWQAQPNSSGRMGQGGVSQTVLHLTHRGGTYPLAPGMSSTGTVNALLTISYGTLNEEEFRVLATMTTGFAGGSEKLAFGPGKIGPYTAVQGRWASEGTGSLFNLPGTVDRAEGVAYYISLPGGGEVMLMTSANGPVAGAEEIHALVQTGQAFLETVRFQVKGAPAPAELPACNATMLIPNNLRPGDTLSPDVNVTSADNKPVQGPYSAVWFINGQQANSVKWDGIETRVTLQLSCQGHAQEFNAVVPAYVTANDSSGGGHGLPLPPIILPPGMGIPNIGGVLSQPPPGMTGVGTVPGPQNLGEALVGILGAPTIAGIGAAISAIAQGATAVATAIPMTPTGPPTDVPPGDKPVGTKDEKKPLEKPADKEDEKKTETEPSASPAQIEALRRGFEENVREKIAEGYWVKNDGLIKSLWNSAADKIVSGDPKGGRCGDFGEWGMGWSKDFVSKTFGDKAIVDDIVIQEPSTLNPQGVLDTVDSVIQANHRATRVILPTGERYVIDYWEGVSTGKPQLQDEAAWIQKWKSRVSPLGSDYVVTRSDSEQALATLVKDWGQERGADIFRRTSTDKGVADTILRSWRKQPW